MHKELTATNNCWWYKISQPNNLLRPLLYKSLIRIFQSPQTRFTFKSQYLPNRIRNWTCPIQDLQIKTTQSPPTS